MIHVYKKVCQIILLSPYTAKGSSTQVLTKGTCVPKTNIHRDLKTVFSKKNQMQFLMRLITFNSEKYLFTNHESKLLIFAESM